MPELPEVEVLVRRLDPALRNQTVTGVSVYRAKIVAPHTPEAFRCRLLGARFLGVTRRAKYLLFLLSAPSGQRFSLLGHLGMTGRMYLQACAEVLPKHCSVALALGRTTLVFEDTRYFGRLTLNTDALKHLGPEPLSNAFAASDLLQNLKRSRQPIKVKLLDQRLLAGLGNIYASETLFRAGISPKRHASRITAQEARRLWHAIRHVLREAIRCGSTVPLNSRGARKRDGLFYFGREPGVEDFYSERLRVYDRAGQPCVACGAAIRRITQAARSTFYCPRCQGCANG